MCTIQTTDMIDESFFTQIETDVATNREGISVVTWNGESYSILKTYDAKNVRALCQGAKRVWVHTRMATTRAKGINFTHAFPSGKYIIMHNGIIRSGMNYDVDTLIICDWLKHHKPTDIQPMLTALSEFYANVFIIDTEMHCYYVIRQKQNSLFKDELGKNYSTNARDDISLPVPEMTCEKIYHEEPKLAKSFGIVEWSKDWDAQWADYMRLEDFEISELKRSVRNKRGASFVATIELLGYGSSKGVQREQVLSVLNSKQQVHYKRINPKPKKYQDVIGM